MSGAVPLRGACPSLWKASPPGRPPTTPAASSPPQGMQAKGTVLGTHARTPASTASGQWTPTAHPEDMQSGEDERLTADAPHNGARHPTRGRSPATPTARNASSQEHMLWSRCWALMPTPPVPGTHGQQALAAHHQGRAAGRGTAPDTRRPWGRAAWTCCPCVPGTGGAGMGDPAPGP